jgi:hypothetical protein
LNHFDAGRDDQQPAEKQHRDDRGCDSAHDRQNPKKQQADAEN